MKVVALGPYYYLQSKWNIFDGMVVILSVIDTAFELNPSVDGFAGTTMFRTFRLVRQPTGIQFSDVIFTCFREEVVESL